MVSTCEYCRGAIQQGAIKCANCGAPLNLDGMTPDFRVCPHCHRKLLALGSPACSYCGRHLPDHYVKAREATLRRLSEAGPKLEDAGKTKEFAGQTESTVKRLIGNLFGFDEIFKRR